MIRYALLFGFLTLASCAVPEPCIAQCGERVCGLDPVCGEPCGSCFDDETCSDAGTCDVICDTADCGPDGCTFDVDVKRVQIAATIDWPGRPGGYTPALAFFPAHGASTTPAFVSDGDSLPAGIWDIYVAAYRGGPLAPLERHRVIDADTTFTPTIRSARISADPGTYLLREPGTHRLLATLATIVGDRVDWEGPPPSYIHAWQGVFDVSFARIATDTSYGQPADTEVPLVAGFVVDSFSDARLPSLPSGRFDVDVTWNGEPVALSTPYFSPEQRVGTFDVPVEHEHGFYLARNVVVREGETTRVEVHLTAPTSGIEYLNPRISGPSTTVTLDGYDGNVLISRYTARLTADGERGSFRGLAAVPPGTYWVDGRSYVVDGWPLFINHEAVALTLDVAFDGVSQGDTLFLERELVPGRFTTIPVEFRSGDIVKPGTYRVRLSSGGAIVAERIVVDAEHTAYAIDVDMVRVRGASGSWSAVSFDDVWFSTPDDVTTYDAMVPAGRQDVGIEWSWTNVPVGHCVLLDDTESP